MESLCFAKRARNLVLFLWSSCHCGCQWEGSDIKRDGWVSCFIICHFGRNSKEATIFNMTTLFLTSTSLTIQKNPLLQHSPWHSDISTHKAQFVTVYSSPCAITYQTVWSSKHCHITLSYPVTVKFRKYAPPCISPSKYKPPKPVTQKTLR